MQLRVVLFEDDRWGNFLPLTYLRPVSALLSGRYSIGAQYVYKLKTFFQEHPNFSLDLSCDWSNYRIDKITGRVDLHEQYTQQTSDRKPTLYLNHRLNPEPAFFTNLLELISSGNAPWFIDSYDAHKTLLCLYDDGHLLPRVSPEMLLTGQAPATIWKDIKEHKLRSEIRCYNWIWEIMRVNKNILLEQWNYSARQGIIEGVIDEGVYLLNKSGIYLGQGSRVKPCTVIDAEMGPVCIAEDVTIQPHCYIEGPVYIGPKTFVQAGSVIRDGTSIGPRCKVGGEIDASIIQGYSNKQHDGFLGHSYIGEWVNIAADCINSDLKNTYGKVRVPIAGLDIETSEMFVGMIMGDYSKAGINVSFSTGSVVGFSSSVVGSNIPKFVPSFAWMNGDYIDHFTLDKAKKLAKTVMNRRQQEFTKSHEKIFDYTLELSKKLENQTAFHHDLS